MCDVFTILDLLLYFRIFSKVFLSHLLQFFWYFFSKLIDTTIQYASLTRLNTALNEKSKIASIYIISDFETTKGFIENRK